MGHGNACFPGVSNGQESLFESLIMEIKGDESRYLTVHRWESWKLDLYLKFHV